MRDNLPLTLSIEELDSILSGLHVTNVVPTSEADEGVCICFSNGYVLSFGWSGLEGSAFLIAEGKTRLIETEWGT